MRPIFSGSHLCSVALSRADRLHVEVNREETCQSDLLVQLRRGFRNWVVAVAALLKTEFSTAEENKGLPFGQRNWKATDTISTGTCVSVLRLSVQTMPCFAFVPLLIPQRDTHLVSNGTSSQ